ncbi:ras association domain-containing protein 9 [Denticeps clupeoides]|uniref:Ras-associating domain-containing protein n=1 Tax=Denticeps clupeoides TaxID=299321 RepID=A0AAY4C9P2_9TELE|nr:ras association domain-containing protein 9 [Denticeps clupeoides]
MAPFGRNFLKARLKSRPKETEETPGKEIQVRVCQEEKVVCGVSKHTTCADIVTALLDDHKTIPESKRLLHGEPKDFCLVEKWRSFERALPPLTRILRLWNAWGDEKPFIQFILVKTADFVPPSKASKRSSKSRSTKSKRWEQCPAQYTKALASDRQKRVVRKAFRKLEKLQMERTPSEGSEEVENMVRLIITQDYTIRQQIRRMRELDADIERSEQHLRSERDASCTPASGLLENVDSPSLAELRWQEHLYTSDGVDMLEAQVHRHQELIEELSRNIDAELRSSEWLVDAEEPQGAAAAAPDLSGIGGEGLESLQAELRRSMRAGLLLRQQAADMEKELQRHSAALHSKSQECQLLATQLGSLQLGDQSAAPSPVPLAEQVTGAGKLRQCQSPTDITDTDSDTGISSTHSQDSLSPTADPRPPLDTDV